MAKKKAAKKPLTAAQKRQIVISDLTHDIDDVLLRRQPEWEAKGVLDEDDAALLDGIASAVIGGVSLFLRFRR